MLTIVLHRLCGVNVHSLDEREIDDHPSRTQGEGMKGFRPPLPCKSRREGSMWYLGYVR